MIHVVVGIIINPQKKVFISQRRPDQAKQGFWEFPGGKVEDGEHPFDALRREFYEEVGIRIIEANHWIQVEHEYPHAHVLLDTWLIKDYVDEPQGKEGQEIAWVSKDEMLQRQFPEGNHAIVAELVKLL
jgi:8-oxo-dGTP diphosphatase